MNSCGGGSPPGVGTAAFDAGTVVGIDGAVIAEGGLAATTEGPVSPEVAAQAAIIWGSCVPKEKAESILRSIYDVESAARTAYRASANCIASRHNGCAALADCVGLTMSRVAENCRPRCDGSVYESCDDFFMARQDCSVLGLACAADSTGRRAGCVEPGAAPCDAGASGCREDGRPTACGSSERQLVGPECSGLGLTCDPLGCKGTGAACSAPSTLSRVSFEYEGTECEGTSLRGCLNGALATFDCGRHVVGATCHGGDAGGAGCRLGAECALSSVGERFCEGDRAVICNRGRVDRIDCKALGFQGCLVLPDDQDKVVCTPGLTY